MTEKDVVQVYEDKAGEFRWRRTSGSDVVADSAEGYTRRSDAKEAALRENPNTPIIIEPDDDEERTPSGALTDPSPVKGPLPPGEEES